MLTLGIGDALTSFTIYIVSLVYGLIADLFHIFVVLAKANTIDSSLYNKLVDNFYLLLAVIMLFIVAFSLLKAMVSPDDNKGTDTSGKVIKNFVTSVVILAFLPTIFSFAFSFQNAIINNNTIGKIFGGSGVYDSNAEKSAEIAGYQMANDVFLSLFTPTDCGGKADEECLSSVSGNAGILTKLKNSFKDILSQDTDVNDGDQYTLLQASKMVSNTGKFSIYTDFSEAVNDGDISFNFIVSLLAGCYLLYVVLSFCLDLGLRLVKLIFYQIIAPIPVFLRIVPDGKLSNTFNDWIKVTFTCYIEVFLRLFVIYFGIYLVAVLPKALEGAGNGEIAGVKWLLAKAIIILGIMTFVKQSPKLIGDLFGFDSSNMNLGLKDKLKTGGVGGLVTAGAILGGQALSTKRVLQTLKKDEMYNGANKKTKAARFAKSIGAGIVGGGYRGFKSGKDIHSMSDFKSSILKNAQTGERSQQARNDLFDRGEGSIIRGYKAKSSDTRDSIREFWTGDQASANTTINAIDEVLGQKSKVKSSVKSLNEKLVTMNQNTLNTKLGSDQTAIDLVNARKKAEANLKILEQTIQSSTDALSREETQLKLDLNSSGITENRKNEIREKLDNITVEKGKISDSLIKAQEDLSSAKKKLEDHMVEKVFKGRENMTEDEKVELADGLLAAAKIRITSLDSNLISSDAAARAKITSDNIGTAGYNSGGEDAPKLKQFMDNLEDYKSELAKSKAIYDATHKNDK